MPRRPPGPAPKSRKSKPPRAALGPAAPRPGTRRAWLGGAAALVVLVGWLVALASGRPGRLKARAEAASAAKDWATAAAAWNALNQTAAAGPESLMAEARGALALGRAAQAERALERAAGMQPSDPEPWLIRLEILRVEDRQAEAARLGRRALEAVAPAARRDVLRALTLALLAETPDDLARTTLGRWVAADPDDLAARAALLRRAASMPRPGDPDRSARIATLEGMLARHPEAADARAALAEDLADAGLVARGAAVLAAWPAAARDARYEYLRGRWALDYDRRPDEAVAAFERALVDLPHDWKTHYRLARALKSLGRDAEARRAAETVGRLREALDSVALGRRLDAALAHPDDPAARLDLADLCARVGLARLADAWRRDASAPESAPFGLVRPPG